MTRSAASARGCSRGRTDGDARERPPEVATGGPAAATRKRLEQLEEARRLARETDWLD